MAAGLSLLTCDPIPASMDNVIKNETFNKISYKERPFQKGEYEKCTFTNCDFSGSDLSEVIFWNCTFNSCDLSLATLIKTSMRDTLFNGCKMLGLRFDNYNKFGLSFSFDNCILDHSSFYQLKLKGTAFKNCRLIEIDLTQCDASNALFENCDLSGTMFDNTVLEKADLRSSYNYTIDPESNKVKKARFSVAGISGLLSKYDIVVEE